LQAAARHIGPFIGSFRKRQAVRLGLNGGQELSVKVWHDWRDFKQSRQFCKSGREALIDPAQRRVQWTTLL
jgi:hypothetical protein